MKIVICLAFLIAQCYCTPNSMSCNQQVDLVFILDRSTSVQKSNHLLALGFIKDVISSFSISSSRARVGLVAYSTHASVIFNLKRYTSLSSLEAAIDDVVYTRGVTNTPDALAEARNILDPANNLGARPSPVPKVAVLLTDGVTTVYKSRVSLEVSKLRQTQIEVFAIGIGEDIHIGELKHIASDPEEEHVLTVDNFRQLQTSVKKISNVICPKPPTLPPTRPKKVIPTQPPGIRCANEVDMALILDRSSSIGDLNFRRALYFLQNVASQFNIVGGAARIGLVAYSDDASIEFDLDDHMTLDSLKNAIQRVPYASGKTNTPAALEKARYILTPRNNHGARSGRIPKIAILVTDGNSNIGNLKSAVTDVRRNGIKTFAIGIGSSIKYSQLKTIADKADYIFRVHSYRKLTRILNSLIRKSCPRQAAALQDHLQVHSEWEDMWSPPDGRDLQDQEDDEVMEEDIMPEEYLSEEWKY